jgi:hypothetical protein
LTANAARKAKGSGKKGVSNPKIGHSSSPSLARSFQRSGFIPKLALLETAPMPGPTALALAPEKPWTFSDFRVRDGKRPGDSRSTKEESQAELAPAPAKERKGQGLCL